MKGRRPSPPTEWGMHNQLGSEASALCFYYRLLCTTRKAHPPPRGMLGCYDLFPGALVCLPNDSPLLPGGLGSMTEAANIRSHVLLSPTCTQEYLWKRRTGQKSCPGPPTWGISVGLSSPTGWLLLIPYPSKRRPRCLGFALF